MFVSSTYKNIGVLMVIYVWMALQYESSTGKSIHYVIISRI